MRITTRPGEYYDNARKIEKPIINRLNAHDTYEGQLAYLNDTLNDVTKLLRLSEGLPEVSIDYLKFTYDLIITWKGLLHINCNHHKKAISYYPKYDQLEENPFNNLLKERAVMAKEALIKQCYHLLLGKSSLLITFIDNQLEPSNTDIKDEKLFKNRTLSLFNLNLCEDVLIPVIQRLYENNELKAVEFFVKNFYLQDYKHLHKKIQNIAYLNDHGAILKYYHGHGIIDNDFYLKFLLKQGNIKKDIDQAIKNKDFSATMVIQYSIVYERQKIFKFVLDTYSLKICFTAAAAWAIAYDKPEYLKCLLEYKSRFDINKAFKTFTAPTEKLCRGCEDKIPHYLLQSVRHCNYISWEMTLLLLDFKIKDSLLLKYIIEAETQLYTPPHYNGSKRNISLLLKLMKDFEISCTDIDLILLLKRYFTNLWNFTQFFLDNHTENHHPNTQLYDYNLHTFVPYFNNLVDRTYLLNTINNTISSRNPSFTLADAFILETEKALAAKNKVTSFGIAAVAFYTKIVYPFHELPEELVYTILSYTFMPNQYTSPEIRNWRRALNRDMVHISIMMQQIGTNDIRNVVSYPDMPIHIKVTRDLADLWEKNYIRYIGTKSPSNAIAL